MLLSLAACYQGSRTAAPDRALELYRASMPADPPPLKTNRLTLDDAIRRATGASAKLAAVRAQAAQAQARVGDAGRVHNPELRVSDVRADEIARDEPKAKVRLRFRPPRPLENGALTAEAEAEARAAESAITTEEDCIEARIIELFARIHAVEAEMATRQRVASLEQDLASRLASRVAQSESTALDQAMAELKAEDAGADVGDARAERLNLLGELGDAIGATVPESTTIEGGSLITTAPVQLPTERELVEQTLRRAPSLSAAASRIDAATARGDAERAKQWPWFTFLDVGYVFEPTAPGSPEGRNWLFGGGIDLPVFDWNQGGVDAADAAQVEAEREFDAEVQKVVREVRGKLRDVNTAADALRRFRTGPIQAAAHAGEEVGRALQAGRMDDVAALAARSKQAAVQLAELKLLRRYLVALGELEAATGWHAAAP